MRTARPKTSLHLAIFPLLCFSLCSAVIAQAPADTGGPAVNSSVFAPDSILGVTAVTQVFGRGQKVTAAIVEFAATLSASGMSPASFSVDERRILSSKVVAVPSLDAPAADGRFVILSLDPTDNAAIIFSADVEQAPQLVLHLAAPVISTDGRAIAPSDKGVINTRVANPRAVCCSTTTYSSLQATIPDAPIRWSCSCTTQA